MDDKPATDEAFDVSQKKVLMIVADTDLSNSKFYEFIEELQLIASKNDISLERLVVFKEQDGGRARPQIFKFSRNGHTNLA